MIGKVREKLYIVYEKYTEKKGRLLKDHLIFYGVFNNKEVAKTIIKDKMFGKIKEFFKNEVRKIDVENESK